MTLREVVLKSNDKQISLLLSLYNSVSAAFPRTRTYPYIDTDTMTHVMNRTVDMPFSDIGIKLNKAYAPHFFKK